jgi:hypothetical protein
MVALACAGCGSGGQDAARIDPVAKAPAAEDVALTTGRSTAATGKEDKSEGVPADTSGTVPLKLPLVEFQAPRAWKKTPPAYKMLDAEYELPRAADDAFDGRLSLMGSGGDRDHVIATRTGEFNQTADAPMQKESTTIDGVETIWVDVRGEWKGTQHDRTGAQQRMEPRPNYRMLLVIFAMSENYSYYAKLTEPQSTIAAHEEEFRKFIHSAKMERAGK